MSPLVSARHLLLQNGTSWGQFTIFCVFASRNFVWPSWITFVSFSSPLSLLYPLLCQKMLKLQQNILNINKAELYFRGATITPVSFVNNTIIDSEFSFAYGLTLVSNPLVNINYIYVNLTSLELLEMYRNEILTYTLFQVLFCDKLLCLILDACFPSIVHLFFLSPLLDEIGEYF